MLAKTRITLHLHYSHLISITPYKTLCIFGRTMTEYFQRRVKLDNKYIPTVGQCSYKEALIFILKGRIANNTLSLAVSSVSSISCSGFALSIGGKNPIFFSGSYTSGAEYKSISCLLRLFI